MPASSLIDVLAVDDRPDNLLALEAILGEVRANVVTASSGEEALRLLLKREFALVLLDVQMPGMDGYETAALIRGYAATRFLPIIFLTAYHRSEANVVRGYELGAVDYLFKPVHPDQLKGKVRVFLDLYRLRREAEVQAEKLREAERTEHERHVEELREHYELSLMREQVERERNLKEAMSLKAAQLEVLVAETEAARRELRRSNERLEVLADTANQLLLGSEPRALVDLLSRKLATHLGFEVYVKHAVEDCGSGLRLAAESGLTDAEVAALRRLEPGESFAGKVALERGSLVVRPADAGRGWEKGVLACFPLLAQGHLLGTLAFGTRGEHDFTQDELALIQGVCNQVAASLERERLIEELRASDRRKDEFLAMLAHELRNPLAPVRNALAVLRARLSDDEVMMRAIGAADRQVDHMTHLVDDLLDVSRITQGKVELRREAVLLSALVEQAVQGCEAIVAQRGHRLSVRLPDEEVTLFVDATRITQVLSNLLHNAAKYTNPGGDIRLEGAVEGRELVMRLTDDGIGISPQMLGRVFDVFVQAETTSDRAQGGLGLGLTLVRRLVEMHDGQVSARSEGLGKGSEFCLRLPLLECAAPAKVAREEAPTLALPDQLDILLVEDNVDIRSTLRDLLELYGHRVTETGDGAQAVEMVLTHPPDVALVDIGLPGLDGYRVAERVRAAAQGQATRLVAITGYGGPADRRRALEAGFDAHLVKPVSPAELSHVLKRLREGVAA